MKLAAPTEVDVTYVNVANDTEITGPLTLNYTNVQSTYLWYSKNNDFIGKDVIINVINNDSMTTDKKLNFDMTGSTITLKELNVDVDSVNDINTGSIIAGSAKPSIEIAKSKIDLNANNITLTDSLIDTTGFAANFNNSNFDINLSANEAISFSRPTYLYANFEKSSMDLTINAKKLDTETVNNALFYFYYSQKINNSAFSAAVDVDESNNFATLAHFYNIRENNNSTYEFNVDYGKYSSTNQSYKAHAIYFQLNSTTNNCNFTVNQNSADFQLTDDSFMYLFMLQAYDDIYKSNYTYTSQSTYRYDYSESHNILGTAGTNLIYLYQYANVEDFNITYDAVNENFSLYANIGSNYSGHVDLNTRGAFFVAGNSSEIKLTEKNEFDENGNFIMVSEAASNIKFTDYAAFAFLADNLNRATEQLEYFSQGALNVVKDTAVLTDDYEKEDVLFYIKTNSADLTNRDTVTSFMKEFSNFIGGDAFSFTADSLNFTFSNTNIESLSIINSLLKHAGDFQKTYNDNTLVKLGKNSDIDKINGYAAGGFSGMYYVSAADGINYLFRISRDTGDRSNYLYVGLSGIEIAAGKTYTFEGTQDIFIDKKLYFEEEDNTYTSSNIDRVIDGIIGSGNVAFVSKAGETETEILLGGKNTYTGSTTIGENVHLTLEDNTVLSGTSHLIIESGGSITVKENGQYANLFDNINAITFLGNKEVHIDGSTTSTFNGGGHTITMSGVGKHFSFFQPDSLENSSAVYQASPVNLVSGQPLAVHNIFEIENLTVNITDGSALWINHLTDEQKQIAQWNNISYETSLAILNIGQDSHINLNGYTETPEKTSAHLYLGNGVIRVNHGGELTLGLDGAIHFSDHDNNFFEWAFDENGNKIETNDPHSHASIEVVAGGTGAGETGGTLNIFMGTQSHIYADSLLSENHKHYLVGLDYEASTDKAFFEVANINVGVTQESYDKVIEQLKAISSGSLQHSSITQETADKVLINLPKLYDSIIINLASKDADITGISMQELYKKFVETNQLSADDFYAGLGIFITLAMNNDVHGVNPQEYGIFTTQNGIYMSVIDTHSITEIAQQVGIDLSLHNTADEVLGIVTNSGELGYQADKNFLNQNSGAYQIVSNAINLIAGGGKTTEDFIQAARIIDASGQLATVGGVQTLAWDMLQIRANSLNKHLYYGHDIPEQKFCLWADMLYMHNDSYDMWTDLNGERRVEANLGGFIAGGDYRYTENSLLGAAFSFMAGTSTTDLGNINGINTENDTYGIAFSLYGEYSFANDYSIRADVTYQHTENELRMNFPYVLGISDSLTADIGTDSIQAQLILEKAMHFSDNLVLTPFIGTKYTYLQTDKYDSELAGKKAYHTDTARQHILSIPIGIKAEKAIVTQSGKIVTPHASVYVQPNFGDTKVTNKVQGYGLRSTDIVHPEVIGKFGFGGNVGADVALTDRTSIGFDYNYNGSDKSQNHGLTLNVVFKF